MASYGSNQDSENVVDSAPPYAAELASWATTEAQRDLVLDPRDETVYGVDPRLLRQLEAIREQVAASREFSTNLSASALAQLQQRLLSVGAQSTARVRRDPYVFRFKPVPGVNQVGLPSFGFILPLPPEKFDVARTQDARTFTSINQIEYSLPGSITLAKVTLEGMFPFANSNDWGERDQYGVLHNRPGYLPKYITAENYVAPHELVSRFTQLMQKAQPVTLSIGPLLTSPGLVHPGGLVAPERAMTFTITNFQYGEAFGHPGSYVFAMELLQWKPIYPPKPKPKPAPATSTAAGEPAPPAPEPPLDRPTPDPPKPKVYTIRSGDTLWDIAARFLGSGQEWRRIYRLNKKVIDDECRRRGSSLYPRGWHIWPGTKIKIPNRSRGEASVVNTIPVA